MTFTAAPAPTQNGDIPPESVDAISLEGKGTLSLAKPKEANQEPGYGYAPKPNDGYAPKPSYEYRPGPNEGYYKRSKNLPGSRHYDNGGGYGGIYKRDEIPDSEIDILPRHFDGLKRQEDGTLHGLGDAGLLGDGADLGSENQGENGDPINGLLGDLGGFGIL